MIHKIGERIGALRKQRAMSQEELATVMNVSRQTISKWETGDTLPDVYNAVSLAKIFHVSLDELILGAHNKYGSSHYISNLKDKRTRKNRIAIIIGAIGSVVFATSIVLLDAFELDRPTIGIIMAGVLPVLMLCWGYAIWQFIQISRISEEIKYLERMELIKLTNDVEEKK